MVERRHDIDWLRVIAVLLLIPFHAGMMFVPWGFHLKNNDESFLILVQNAFLNQWHMPLLFFLSGIGTWYAMGFRSAGQYAKERVLRLFVPLIAGMLIIVPPQVYLERLYDGDFAGSYFEFYPHFFHGVYPEGNLSWHHLWFLCYLFLFSIILLPLFNKFRHSSRESLTKFVDMFSGRFTISLPAIPFMIGQVIASQPWPNGDQNLIGDLDNFIMHMIIFFYGFAWCSSERIQERTEKNRTLSLIVASILTVFIFKTYLALSGDGREISRLVGAALLMLHGIMNWAWILAILGYGRRYLNFSNSFLKYAVSAALPFYIIHQTVIITLGYFVIQQDWPVAIKYPAILFPAFIGTVLIYDVFVKRTNFTRFLFGMRPPKN